MCIGVRGARQCVPETPLKCLWPGNEFIGVTTVMSAKIDKSLVA